MRCPFPVVAGLGRGRVTFGVKEHAEPAGGRGRGLGALVRRRQRARLAAGHGGICRSCADATAHPSGDYGDASRSRREAGTARSSTHSPGAGPRGSPLCLPTKSPFGGSPALRRYSTERQTSLPSIMPAPFYPGALVVRVCGPTFNNGGPQASSEPSSQCVLSRLNGFLKDQPDLLGHRESHDLGP